MDGSRVLCSNTHPTPRAFRAASRPKNRAYRGRRSELGLTGDSCAPKVLGKGNPVTRIPTLEPNGYEANEPRSRGARIYIPAVDMCSFSLEQKRLEPKRLEPKWLEPKWLRTW